jgi:hypothetical protein
MPTKTKTPAPSPARKLESAAVRKARSDVNAAANEFETARAAMARAGEDLSQAPNNAKLKAAFDNARIVYQGMTTKLQNAQQALGAAK